jgi:hypothetical protein
MVESDAERIMAARIGQAQLAHDRLDAVALGQQRLHLLIPPASPLHQGGLFYPRGSGLGRNLLQIRFWHSVGGQLGFGFYQAAAVAGHGLLHAFGKVVPQVPPVGDLDRLWCAGSGSV